MSYLFRDGRFYMVTSPESLHGRLMQRTGRATLTVQFEACDGRNVYQWYVIAEGTIGFTDSEPGPYVRAILAKDRIRSVEVLEYPELGMEAVWRIEVEDFPAFIIVDDKGNDFYAQFAR